MINNNLPYDLYSVNQIRKLNKIANEWYNITPSDLMKHAGDSALNTIKNHWPQAERLLVICGTGNNAGDGFYLAKQALDNGYRVVVYQVGNNEKLNANVDHAKKKLLAAGNKVYSFKDSLPSTDLIIDAILGIGINRAVTGKYKKAIQMINEDKYTSVLSMDTPSGLNADTGNTLGIAVKANATISFMSLKRGLFTGEGPNYCGTIYFNSLEIPCEIYHNVFPIARRINLENNSASLVPRERIGHKGSYGHLFIIGGDYGMYGAALIAAEAGARAGAGLISVVTQSTEVLVNFSRPELMCHSVEYDDDLSSLLSIANVLCIGPGLGQNKWGESLFKKSIETNLPLIVDADALNLLSKHPSHHDQWILTPHPGEAARLLNCSSQDIQNDRFEAVRELQSRYGGIAILKGSGTLIYDGNSPIRLSNLGNPGMGSGGMGDLLAGMIGGLLAQHLFPMNAACIGVIIHGMAADRVAKKNGERGMLAMDLMPHVRHLVNLAY